MVAEITERNEKKQMANKMVNLTNSVFTFSPTKTQTTEEIKDLGRSMAGKEFELVILIFPQRKTQIFNEVIYQVFKEQLVPVLSQLILQGQCYTDRKTRQRHHKFYTTD